MVLIVLGSLLFFLLLLLLLLWLLKKRREQADGLQVSAAAMQQATGAGAIAEDTEKTGNATDTDETAASGALVKSFELPSEVPQEETSLGEDVMNSQLPNPSSCWDYEGVKIENRDGWDLYIGRQTGEPFWVSDTTSQRVDKNPYDSE